jgi:hypothetical protein
MTTLFVVTPSSIRWGDIFEENLLTHSSDSEGAQTYFSWIPSLGVTGPPRKNSVSYLLRQRVGEGDSNNQILMRRSDREPWSLEPHLAIEMGKLGSRSTSGGSYLLRDKVGDLGEISISRCSW